MSNPYKNTGKFLPSKGSVSTLFHCGARNSFTSTAFWAYDRGDIQYPHIHQGLIDVLGSRNPPRTKTTKRAKDPPVFATTMVRQIPAIKRKRADAMECTLNISRSWRKNLYVSNGECHTNWKSASVQHHEELAQKAEWHVHAIVYLAADGAKPTV